MGNPPPGTKPARRGFHLVPCTGEAHINPVMFDSCALCVPRWGWVEVPDRFPSLAAWRTWRDGGRVVVYTSKTGRRLLTWVVALGDRPDDMVHRYGSEAQAYRAALRLAKRLGVEAWFSPSEGRYVSIAHLTRKPADGPDANAHPEDGTCTDLR